MPNRITAPQSPFPGLYDAYWTNVVYPYTMEEKPKVEYRGAQKNPLLYALQQLMFPATQQSVQTPNVPLAPQGTSQPVISSNTYGAQRNPLQEAMRRLYGGM